MYLGNLLRLIKDILNVNWPYAQLHYFLNLSQLLVSCLLLLAILDKIQVCLIIVAVPTEVRHT